MEFRRKNTALIAAIGIIAVMLVMVIGTIQNGQSAKNATDEAVRTVSSLYLDELAGRREKVVSDNLKDKISDIHTALELIEESDLYSMESLQAYQSKMKSVESSLTMPRTISNAWVAKMKQAYQKAAASFPNDPAFSYVRQLYVEKMTELKMKLEE